MKYLATINFGNDSHSQSFNTIVEAEKWLDSENNNDEHRTTISEMDDEWNIKDWFVYTEGTK